MEKMKQIVGKVRKACQMYNLIDDGDKIAIGVSGGKDSLTLLTAMASLRHFYEKKFDIVAICIDLFDGKSDLSQIEEYCKKLNVPFIRVDSHIKRVVFDIRKEAHPCSLCANLRRGILNNEAIKAGCNKVALGHHADDFVETFFMSMFYESRLNTFLPMTKMTNKNLWVIRPMVLCYEKDIISASKDLPILFNKCPADKHTKREYMKKLIHSLEKENIRLCEHIMSAIMNFERYNLFDKANKIKSQQDNKDTEN